MHCHNCEKLRTELEIARNVRAREFEKLRAERDAILSGDAAKEWMDKYEDADFENLALRRALHTIASLSPADKGACDIARRALAVLEEEG